MGVSNVDWSPVDGVRMCLIYCSADRSIEDFTLEVVLTDGQKCRLFDRLQSQCQKVYGKSMMALYNEVVFKD